MNELLIHLCYIQEAIGNKPLTKDHIRIARNNIQQYEMGNVLELESSLELIK